MRVSIGMSGGWVQAIKAGKGADRKAGVGHAMLEWRNAQDAVNKSKLQPPPQS